MKVTQMMVYADLMSYMPPTALKFADLDKAVSFEYSLIIPSMGTTQLCLIRA